MATRIHPTAICDVGAEVGDGTAIWHFCHVRAGARIGKNCSLGQNCYVAASVVIGDNTRLQNNVSLYDGVTLEQDVFCGPSCVFTNVSRPRAHERAETFEKTRVCRGATIGANATVRCGVTLGPYCFVGAGAVVTRDVPPHALMLGVPARRTGWVSRAGEALRFDDQGLAMCPSEGSQYRLIDGAVIQAVAQ